MGGVAGYQFRRLLQNSRFLPTSLQENSTLVATVVEAEYPTLFANGQQMYWFRTLLEALGYPQKPSTLYCDNSVAKGIAMDELTIKRSKAIDVRYHWLRER